MQWTVVTIATRGGVAGEGGEPPSPVPTPQARYPLEIRVRNSTEESLSPSFRTKTSCLRFFKDLQPSQHPLYRIIAT